MFPTHLQNTKPHCPIVDCLIWPSLRDLMLAIDCTYSSEDNSLQYNEAIRFSWPYDARDMYKISVTTGPAKATANLGLGMGMGPAPPPTERKMYSFTHEYEERYQLLSSWSLKPGCKCLFQQPRLNLNYCDLFGVDDDANGHANDGDEFSGGMGGRGSAGRVAATLDSSCFLCEADVTTTTAAAAAGVAKKAGLHRDVGGVGQVPAVGAAVGGIGQGSVGIGVSMRRYEAVYPNILLDM